MSIADVLKTPEFFKELSRLLGTLSGSRDKARRQAGGALKAHPIDKLIDEGVWEADKFSVLYALQIVFPSSLREILPFFLFLVGGELPAGSAVILYIYTVSEKDKILCRKILKIFK